MSWLNTILKWSPWLAVSIGTLLFAIRVWSVSLNPYQVGRVWQTFEIARELGRTGGVPWKTEISVMAGGTKPAPLTQEFPVAQYVVLGIRRITSLDVAAAGQWVAVLVAIASVAVWVAYAAEQFPSAAPLLIAALLCLPGFLQFGVLAVPDSIVFLTNLAGACLVFGGRRKESERRIAAGAALIGISVLVKSTAALPAAAFAVALALDRRWRAITVLTVAMVPGVAWALLAAQQNRQAAEVNEFARVFAIREYWWNPRLYITLWWPRGLAWMLFDVLGAFGAAATGVLLTVAVCRRWWFEAVVVAGPALALIIVFNYHSASHAYYHLLWLPLAVVALCEIALAWNSGALIRPAVLAAVSGFMVFGAVERAYGLLERTTGHSSAVAPFLAEPPPKPSARAQQATMVLSRFKDSNQFIAYLGDSGGSAFSTLGLRGWIVSGPMTAEAAAHTHLPPSVLEVLEARRVGPAWFRERLGRGMAAAVIEQQSTWDVPVVLSWAREAGLEVSDTSYGHVLLVPRPAHQ